MSLRTTETAVLGAWGVDLSALDRSVRPGDDFFGHANGGWLRTAQVPADRTRWGMWDQLQEAAERNVYEIIAELVKSRPEPGSAQRKVADYFAAYVDQSALDELGLAPARRGLAAIAAAATHEDIVRLLMRRDLGVGSPLAAIVALDAKDPDRYVVAITHAGLGLPDREYYLSDAAKFAELRAEYRAHIARLLQLGGAAPAQESAARVLALETQIAKLHWPRAKRRERELTYNPRSKQDLLELAPEFPWQVALETAGLEGQSFFVVRELDAIAPLARLVCRTPVADWRAYLGYHYLRVHASVLPRLLDEEVFHFHGRTLNGQPQQRERWKRGIDAVNGALAEAVGELYVARHFPEEAKRAMQALVENVRKAYAERIERLEWMTPQTKARAQEKLAAFRPKIAYPDRWRDYSALEVVPGDAFGNLDRARLFDWQRALARLGKPSDRDEWGMSPQTVNAYYNASFNEIVFPAAILQPPFFDANADPAVNYGAIGGVIGHEMGHGFDDQGSKSDARGVLRNWWNESDLAAFQELGNRLDGQYSKFEPLPGLALNGRLTLGENIGDLGGLSVALCAYQLSLNGSAAPVIDGFQGEQRFFFGWAQVWRSLHREERMRTLVMTDPHSPPAFRVNGVVRNMDAWYEAFGVAPDDKLYLDPEQRVRVW
jgi:putative endopeptidase